MPFSLQRAAVRSVISLPSMAMQSVCGGDKYVSGDHSCSFGLLPCCLNTMSPGDASLFFCRSAGCPGRLAEGWRILSPFCIVCRCWNFNCPFVSGWQLRRWGVFRALILLPMGGSSRLIRLLSWRWPFTSRQLTLSRCWSCKIRLVAWSCQWLFGSSGAWWPGWWSLVWLPRQPVSRRAAPLLRRRWSWLRCVVGRLYASSRSWSGWLADVCLSTGLFLGHKDAGNAVSTACTFLQVKNN